MLHLWYVEQLLKGTHANASVIGASTGAMGQPTPAPPPDLTEDEALSYIDPGYEVLEKVRGTNAIPKTIAQLSDPIPLSDIHDVGIRLHQDEHRRFLPSPLCHR
jgi:hypothetical protein